MSRRFVSPNVPSVDRPQRQTRPRAERAEGVALAAHGGGSGRLIGTMLLALIATACAGSDDARELARLAASQTETFTDIVKEYNQRRQAWERHYAQLTAETAEGAKTLARENKIRRAYLPAQQQRRFDGLREALRSTFAEAADPRESRRRLADATVAKLIQPSVDPKALKALSKALAQLQEDRPIGQQLERFKAIAKGVLEVIAKDLESAAQDQEAAHKQTDAGAGT